MAGRWAWVVVALAGLGVAIAVFVWLGFVWDAHSDGYWCGTTFNRADNDGAVKERCDREVNERVLLEVIVAAVCGLVAASVTAGVLGRHDPADPPPRDWLG